MKMIFTLAVIVMFISSFTLTPATHDNFSFESAERKGKITGHNEFNLDINETVDSINNMLNRFSMYGSKIRINIKGTVIITNSGMQFFHFSLSDLAGPGAMISCDKEQYIISFNSAKGKMAYIKFNAIGREELDRLHGLFVYLHASMMDIINP